MSLDLLGDGFDIHAGGQDLAFPHHENERAQAVAEGHRFAKHWMHHGFVEVSGEKMSKSLGNYTNLLDLIDESDPRAYRLLVLRTHYRTPMEVTKETIADAERGLERLDRFAEKFAAAVGGAPDETALAQFRESMDDDMSTPAAMALLFELVTRANADEDLSAAATAFEICNAVGLEVRTTSGEVGDDALAVGAERDEARAAKDWARADELRDRLIEMGYEVEDTPTGTRLRKQ
jgi:cysteinyl-tRNA synthetase